MDAVFPTPDVVIDTGPQGCGELVMTLAQRFRQIPAGSVVAVLSRDPGALADLPAWCRLQGHALLGSEPAGDGTRFYIRRGERP